MLVISLLKMRRDISNNYIIERMLYCFVFLEVIIRKTFSKFIVVGLELVLGYSFLLKHRKILKTIVHLFG